MLESGRHRIYPVVDAAGRPVGLVSRADALRWSRDRSHDAEPLSGRISDASIAVVHPEDTVSDAVDLMIATDQGRLPVTDPQTGALVGLLTRKHLLRIRASVVREERERQVYLRRPATRAEVEGKVAAEG